jgi:HD superfamily phosphohydrolase
LLHDIGHGPFSHSSEEVYGHLPQFGILREQIPGAKPHEILAYLILTSDRFKEYSKAVFDKLEESRIETDELAGMIVGISKDDETPYKHELLNGPFDADKLDYLYRDSHFSGLPLSVDLDRLFYTVHINKSPVPDSKYRLIVTHSGATSLEQILFSKMVLFTTVYQHHKVRTCDCMFAGIIEYMQKNNITMKIKGREISWNSPVDYLWITDDELLSFGFETEDDNLHNLIHNLFFRRLLKRALVLSHKTIEKNDEDR